MTSIFVIISNVLYTVSQKRLLTLAR